VTPASILLHDWTLGARGDGVALLEPLLGHFSNAGAERAAELEIELELQPSAGPLPPFGERLAVLGRVALYQSAQGFVVSDGASWVEAGERPPAVRGRLRLESAEPSAAKEVAYTALLLALRSFAVYELHAAAVQAQGFAIVLVGDSGSGKTTLATALLEAGCGYLGDDRLLLRRRGDALEILSFPVAFRLTGSTASAFPRLEPWLGPPRAKRELDLRGAYPGKHVPRARSPIVLLFPKRAARTELLPLTAQQALALLLAESSSLVVPRHPAPERQLAVLRDLAQGALPLSAELGPEWLEAPVAAAHELLVRCCTLS